MNSCCLLSKAHQYFGEGQLNSNYFEYLLQREEPGLGMYNLIPNTCDVTLPFFPLGGPAVWTARPW